jgi:hypothetical protein
MDGNLPFNAQRKAHREGRASATHIGRRQDSHSCVSEDEGVGRDAESRQLHDWLQAAGQPRITAGQ